MRSCLVFMSSIVFSWNLFFSDIIDLLTSYYLLIPSNTDEVCRDNNAGECPAVHMMDYFFHSGFKI